MPACTSAEVDITSCLCGPTPYGGQLWHYAGAGSTAASYPKPCHRAQVSDSFPFKWINKKWKEGFYVTSMATSHTRWAVVMSRNAGYIDQAR